MMLRYLFLANTSPGTERCRSSPGWNCYHECSSFCVRGSASLRSRLGFSKSCPCTRRCPLSGTGPCPVSGPFDPVGATRGAARAYGELESGSFKSRQGMALLYKHSKLRFQRPALDRSTL